MLQQLTHITVLCNYPLFITPKTKRVRHRVIYIKVRFKSMQNLLSQQSFNKIEPKKLQNIAMDICLQRLEIGEIERQPRLLPYNTILNFILQYIQKSKHQ